MRHQVAQPHTDVHRLSFLVAKPMLLSIAQPPSGPPGVVMVAAGSGSGRKHDTSGEEQQDTR